MFEVSAELENIELERNVIGRTAVLREDITVSDVIAETASKPYYAKSISTKQEGTYSPAPSMKIRLAISVVIAMSSFCFIVLAECAIPFGCMAQPLRWGGVLRAIHGEVEHQQKLDYNYNAQYRAQNLVSELQVLVLASSLAHVIMKTEKYNSALRLAVICATASWLASCSNAFVWSPSFMNCVDRYEGPTTGQLAPGMVTQCICSGCFAFFALRRLLLLNQVVMVFPGYSMCVKVLGAFSVLFATSAVAVRESFGQTVPWVLYFIAGVLFLCVFALTLALFSKAFRSLRSANVSDVDITTDAKNAMKMLKWERVCIASTLLTLIASLLYTGSCYLLKQDGRLKYVVYSFDAIVNACCFAYLMQSSERRLVGYNNVRDIQQDRGDPVC